jgi:hypothetical protein
MMTADEIAEMNANLGPAAPKGADYRPYCLICPTMLRMELQEHKGFQCQNCRNEVGFDGTRRPESRPNVFLTYPEPSQLATDRASGAESE